MKKNNKICLYILNYNYGNYLRECVESVMRQSIIPFEIFLIDDGSEDNSHEIIKKIKEDYPSINFIFQSNIGLISSILKILKLSDADYFIRVDADDWISPTLIEELLLEIESNDNVGLVYPDYYEVNEQGRKLRRVQRHNVMGGVTLLDMPAHGACTMIRRAALEANQDLFDDIECQDGVDVWLSVIKKYEVRNVNKPLFYYRQHNTSLSKNEDRLLENRRKIYARHARDISSGKLQYNLILPISRRDTKVLVTSNNTEKVNYLADFLSEADENININQIIVCYEEGVDINFLENNVVNFNKISYVRRSSELAEQGVPILKTVKYLIENSFLDNRLPISVQAAGYPMMKVAYHEMALYSQKIYKTDIVDSVRLDQSIFYSHNGKTLESLVPGEYRHERNLIFRRVGGLRFYSQKFLSSGEDETSKNVILGHIEIDRLSSISWEDFNLIRCSDGLIE